MLKTGYYSINDLKNIILPNIYSSGDILRLPTGESITVIGSYKLNEINFSFINSEVLNSFKKHPPNSKFIIGLIVGGGVMLIHESEVVKD